MKFIRKQKLLSLSAHNHHVYTFIFIEDVIFLNVIVFLCKLFISINNEDIEL